jgi:hypothetical protein
VAATLFAFAPTAVAQDSANSPSAGGSSFAIELSFDQVLIEVAEASPVADPAMPPAAAPFADAPMFKLGPPQLAGGSATSFGDGFFDGDEFGVRCASRRCSDLAASFAVTAEGDDVNLSFGATAGVADRLPSFESATQRPRWYLFVAADAQAMSWNFAGDDNASSVQLDELRLLGDVQAGVGGRIAGGDLAMGYVSREVSHMGASRIENFVGVTFGWDGT